MPCVTSLPDNVGVAVADGETLLEAALRSGIPWAHACGGRAKCSTCRVWVLDGLAGCPVRSDAEAAMAARLGLSDEVRLACQLRPADDLRVRRLVLDETDLVMTSQLDRTAVTRAGEVRNVTIFFSDITDFTAISETLTPYDVVYLLNRYFVQAGEIIEANGGYIDKFMGDGIMAIFGIGDADSEGPDAPLRAVNAALQTLALVDRLKPFFKSMYALDLDIRIGLHHGETLIGSVGSAGNERLTAIGDVVNVASRVEVANKEAGTRLLVTQAVFDAVEGRVEVADFVRTRLRGTSERVTLYEIARLTPEAEAALNARAVRDTMQFAGRRWVRALRADELAVGERRILDFDNCDVVVLRGTSGWYVFDNACPHLKLPFFERRQRYEHDFQPPRDSRINGNLGLVCRWHETEFDLQTGEIRSWCTKLNEDGTPPGFEFIGDVSKYREPLKLYPSRFADGHLWISLG